MPGKYLDYLDDMGGPGMQERRNITPMVNPRHPSPGWIIPVCLLLACPLRATNAQPVEQPLGPQTLAWMQTVLDGWEVVCRQHLRVPVQPLPWIIFYDETRAWHLNPERRWLPPHQETTTTLRFAEQTYPLFRVAHQGEALWVPGRDAIEPTPQAVTMLYDEEQQPFFIIALPALYHNLAGADQAAHLDEFFLGLAAHELTHTRQVVHAARHIKRLRTRYPLPEDIDDNMIQRDFGADADYKASYEQERNLLTNAILATDLDSCRRAVGEALSFIRQRRTRYFVGAKAGYAALEDLFLALEGLAMWVQYQTALARAPAEETWLQTLISLSERTDAWSQEEGLGMFLLIDRLVPEWQSRFLAPDFPSPLAVLAEAIQPQRSLEE